MRILAPGKVYRADSDVTHTPMFHQIEGLVVDEGITFAHLKGTLQLFAERMFGAHTKIRLRPSYFPLYRAQCRGGCFLYHLRRRWVPGLQRDRLA